MTKDMSEEKDNCNGCPTCNDTHLGSAGCFVHGEQYLQDKIKSLESRLSALNDVKWGLESRLKESEEEVFIKCKQNGVLLERLSQAEAELEQAHKILDADPSMIIRNAKDGYPEGRPDRVLTLAERVKALCKYGSDYVRWLKESEARLSQAEAENKVLRDENVAYNKNYLKLMDVAEKLSEWVEGYIDYLGHEDCGNECQQGEMRKEIEKLIAEWDGIKKEEK